jgi:hypothetical protein
MIPARLFGLENLTSVTPVKMEIDGGGEERGLRPSNVYNKTPRVESAVSDVRRSRRTRGGGGGST